MYHRTALLITYTIFSSLHSAMTIMSPSTCSYIPVARPWGDDSLLTEMIATQTYKYIYTLYHRVGRLYKWGWSGYAIYVMQNKNINNSEQKNLRFLTYIFMIYARISIYQTLNHPWKQSGMPELEESAYSHSFFFTTRANSRLPGPLTLVRV